MAIFGPKWSLCLMTVWMLYPAVLGSNSVNFRCDAGEALVGFESYFIAQRHERFFYNLSCRATPGYQGNEQCQDIIWSTGGEMVRCPRDGYVAGLKLEENAKGKIHRFLCCEHGAAQLLSDSCYEQKSGRTFRYSRLSLCRGEVVKGVKAVSKHSSDHCFTFEICSFKQQSLLRAQVYSEYSLRQLTRFGNPNNSYSCGTQCDYKRQQAILRLDSIWSNANTDRAFDAVCGRVSKLPYQCSHIRYSSPDGPLPVDGRPLAASSWDWAGCGGHELLVSIDSKYVDGVRRYTFGCCVLSKQLLEEASCKWTTPSTDRSYVIEAPRGWILRGVGGTFDGKYRDRKLRFEMCQLTEFADRHSQCNFAARSLTGKAEHQMLHVFRHEKVENSQQCAQSCHRHPFCISAGYSPPNASQSRGTCFLSYRRDQSGCPSLLTQSVQGGTAAWIYCIICS